MLKKIILILKRILNKNLFILEENIELLKVFRGLAECSHLLK